MNIETNKLWCDNGHLSVDQADFMQKLSKEQNPEYCLETGFCTGRSCLSVILGAEKSIKKFVTLDINCRTREISKEFLELIESEYSFCKGIEGNSFDILNQEFFEKEFPNGIDWFTVDGDHTYAGCKNDLQSVLPYMNKNSVIIIDDYESCPPNGCSIPEVTNACDHFYGENSDKLSREKWNVLGKGFCIFKVKQ